jgi:hypothetical protein
VIWTASLRARFFFSAHRATAVEERIVDTNSEKLGFVIASGAKQSRAVGRWLWIASSLRSSQ